MSHQTQGFPAFADDDLDLFTNTEFFDFDPNVPVPDIFNDISFTNGQNQQYPGVTPFSGNISAPNSLPPSPPNGLPFAGQFQQSQPTVPSAQDLAVLLPAYPTQPQQTTIQPQPGQKRKAGSISATTTSPTDFVENTRVAAEEDKRRRNTAASARFRVKKKQREQALEQTAREMTERVHVLEARVGQLEMENKWLKGLVTEKNIPLDGAPIGVDVTAGAEEEAEDEEASA